MARKIGGQMSRVGKSSALAVGRRTKCGELTRRVDEGQSAKRGMKR